MSPWFQTSCWSVLTWSFLSRWPILLSHELPQLLLEMWLLPKLQLELHFHLDQIHNFLMGIELWILPLLSLPKFHPEVLDFLFLLGIMLQVSLFLRLPRYSLEGPDQPLASQMPGTSVTYTVPLDHFTGTTTSVATISNQLLVSSHLILPL